MEVRRAGALAETPSDSKVGTSPRSQMVPKKNSQIERTNVQRRYVQRTTSCAMASV
jgi:hypothetical protein